MLVPDVNILLNASRPDTKHHELSKRWLEDALDGPDLVGLHDHVLIGFVRISTHPKIFNTPSPLDEALGWLQCVLDHQNSVKIASGDRWWSVLNVTTTACGATGNLISDAHIAAVASEHGARVVTLDRDFKKLAGRTAIVLTAN